MIGIRKKNLSKIILFLSLIFLAGFVSSIDVTEKPITQKLVLPVTFRVNEANEFERSLLKIVRPVFIGGVVRSVLIRQSVMVSAVKPKISVSIRAKKIPILPRVIKRPAFREIAKKFNATNNKIRRCFELTDLN